VLEELGEFIFSEHLQVLLSHLGQTDPTGQVFVHVPLTMEPREEGFYTANVIVESFVAEGFAVGLASSAEVRLVGS
jgi:hypothetical protein